MRVACLRFTGFSACARTPGSQASPARWVTVRSVSKSLGPDLRLVGMGFAAVRDKVHVKLMCQMTVLNPS